MSAPEILPTASPIQACLRVALDNQRTTPELEALVGKLVGAFFESRWSWPRYFERAAPYAFMLSDPRTVKIDLEELRHLAIDLQSKLFGHDGAGGVDLLVFEGDEVEVHRFSKLDAEALRNLLAGQSPEPELVGSLSNIQPKGVVPVAFAPPPEPAWTSVEDDSVAGLLALPDDERRLEPGFRGSYFIPHGVFTGSLLYMKPFGATSTRAILDRPEVLAGMDAEAYDAAAAQAAGESLARFPGHGLIFLPLSFSSLVRPAGRRTYGEFLKALAGADRSRLAATVYDTPRKPSFFAMSQMVAFLNPYFSQINLSVCDPAFAVDLSPPGIHSVAFVTPDADAPTRQAAIRRFAQFLPEYRRKRIWPIIDGVKTHAEIDLCAGLRVPLISGPGVSELADHPLGGRRAALADLPLKRAG